MAARVKWNLWASLACYLCAASGNGRQASLLKRRHALRSAALIGVTLALAVMLGTCARQPLLLDEIRASGELRVITRAGPTTVYQGVDGAEGPEYDLLRGFASHLGVELVIEEAARFADLLQAVESGRVHLAAAGLTITAERASRVRFGPPYQEVQQLLVHRIGTPRPESIADTIGRRLEVVAFSSYVDYLIEARRSEPALIWSENPGADAGELLTAIADGLLDFTIVDSNLFEIYRSYLPELRAVSLAGEEQLAWAFARHRDESLISEAERYLSRLRSTGDLAYIMERYYGHKQRFDYANHRKFIRDFQRTLPRYEQRFRAAGADFGLDWRLLAALGYQESHWDPLAISNMGAQGLMMLTSNTATAMDVNDPFDASESIYGGARYLAKMRDRVPAHIPEPDRTWMALAAYNMGYSHLIDAREITRMTGGDPDRWADVKETLPLLMQRRWYSQVRRGYARGWQTRIFVESIRNYYDILIWLTGSEEVQQDDPPESALTAAATPLR